MLLKRAGERAHRNNCARRPEGKLRQSCWAHLRRDFQATIERGKEGSAVCEELPAYSDMLVHWWHRVRDGTMSRATLREYAAELRTRARARLRAGWACAKTAGTCQELPEGEPGLWTFVEVERI